MIRFLIYEKHVNKMKTSSSFLPDFFSPLFFYQDLFFIFFFNGSKTDCLTVLQTALLFFSFFFFRMQPKRMT